MPGPEPQMVVPVKKKKKGKKVVTHAEPDLAALGLGNGPPGAATSAEQPHQAKPATKEAAEQSDSQTRQPHNDGPVFHVPEGDEFRNVWGDAGR